MATNAILECTVCFDATHKFKVLDCKHEFCANCCETLKRELQPANNVDSKSESILSARATIECPKCRSITDVSGKGVEGLESHFIGNITCYQCDTEKLTKEFRWCHTCSRSVCSSCFIDKHINADGVGFHDASKWDSHVGVKSAVNRLVQMSLEHKQITEKCKTDVTTYLEGLNTHLVSKLDETGKAGSHRSMADAIANSYGISKEEISSSNSIPDDQFYYILSDAKKVAKISHRDADLVEVHFQQFSYEQLEKSFLRRNIPLPTHCDYNRLSNLQSKLIVTESIGLDMVSNPIDLVVLSSDEAIILDLTGPYHYRNSVCVAIPLRTRRSIPIFNPLAGKLQSSSTTPSTPKEFGKILVVPNNRNQVMITGLVDLYVYFLLTKNENNQYEQWQDTGGQLEWTLPGKDKVIASTERLYTFNYQSIFVYDHKYTMISNFTEIFQSAYKYASFTELCHVHESPKATDFYIVGNPKWHRLEIVQLDKISNRLVSWRNVNLSLLCPDLVFNKPMICATGTDGLYLVWDRQSTTLYVWNRTTNACTLTADFRSKQPQVIKFFENTMYIILFDMITRIERIEL